MSESYDLLNQSLTVFVAVGTITSLCGHWLLDCKRMNVSVAVRMTTLHLNPMSYTFLLSMCELEAVNLE
jgi:hypothetical protein